MYSSHMKIKKALLAFCLTTAFNIQASPALNSCKSLNLNNCPTPVDTKLPDVKNMLTWNQQQRTIGFRNDYRSYNGDVFHAANGQPLPRAPQNLSMVDYQLHGKSYQLKDYLKRNNVTGMMVIKDGKVVWDYYANGNNPTTLWTSRSVGKSVVSTLIGVALKEGKIKSLDDEVVKYNHDVRGTAWEHVTIRQLLQHTSGVSWNEDYTNPQSDFSQLTQCEAHPNTYACVNNLVKDPKRKAYAKPGKAWSYSSGGAWLLGDTLEKATGVSIAKYLQDKIWQPYGMSRDGVWHSYAVGKHDVGAHGFNATLEDWGKFGLFVMNNGILPTGKQILPQNWVKDARSWNKAKNSVSKLHPEGTYGYEWWNNSVPATATNVAPKTGLNNQDSMWALGIYGQIIMINQAQKLVIVQWSTWPKAEPSMLEQPLEASLMFNAIANKLAL